MLDGCRSAGHASSRRRPYSGSRPSDFTVRRLVGSAPFEVLLVGVGLNPGETSGQTCPPVVSYLFALPSLCCLDSVGVRPPSCQDRLDPSDLGRYREVPAMS